MSPTLLVASVFEKRLVDEGRRHPRAVGLEERFATLLPEVLIGIGLDQFAALAAREIEPKVVPEVSLHHIHATTVSVREQRRDHQTVVAGLARADMEAPSWLAVDKDARQARVTSLPDETSIPFPIEVQLIIEYYSQRL